MQQRAGKYKFTYASLNLLVNFSPLLTGATFDAGRPLLLYFMPAAPSSPSPPVSVSSGSSSALLSVFILFLFPVI